MNTMKRVGEIISAFFDEGLTKKAQGYSKLFASWAEITRKNNIAAAVDYSRIRELENGVLLIEVDHPGWKQIVQTKQSKLLNDYRRCFPELDISGISLMLSRKESPSGIDGAEQGAGDEDATQNAPKTIPPKAAVPPSGQTGLSGYNDIKNEVFRESLQRLERTIAKKEGAGRKT